MKYKTTFLAPQCYNSLYFSDYFNGVLYKGVSHNPLITLSEIVKNKIGEEIPVSIVRKNKDNILHMEKLNIIPHTWNGRGVLGCKFQII